MPQNPFAALSPGLPVRDSILNLNAFEEVAHLTGRAGELLPLLASPPSALSGGQLQRLRILASIAANPKDLLFLDEPFAHQDDGWVETLTSLLSKVGDHELVGRVFVVSHDIKGILQFCDRILLLAEFYLPAEGDALVITLPILDMDLERRSSENCRLMTERLSEVVECEGFIRYYERGEKEPEEKVHDYLNNRCLRLKVDRAYKWIGAGGAVSPWSGPRLEGRQRAVEEVCEFLEKLKESLM